MVNHDPLQYRADICERIASARLHAGLTQKQLAVTIGSNPRTVRAWEAGVVPSADWIGLVADACRVSVEYLIGRPDGETVYLINRRIEADLLRDESPPDERTWNRLARLGSIADRDLASAETQEQWVDRIRKVWQHVDVRSHRSGDDDQENAELARHGNTARRRSR